MVCPKCQSEKVEVQIASETNLQKKHHGILYWLLIGWWLQPILWLCFTLPMIVITIFKPKNYKTKTTHQSMAVCQICGYHWNA